MMGLSSFAGEEEAGDGETVEEESGWLGDGLEVSVNGGITNDYEAALATAPCGILNAVAFSGC